MTKQTWIRLVCLCISITLLSLLLSSCQYPLKIKVTNNTNEELIVYALSWQEQIPQTLIYLYYLGTIPPKETISNQDQGYSENSEFMLFAEKNIGQPIYEEYKILPISTVYSTEVIYRQILSTRKFSGPGWQTQTIEASDLLK